MKTQLKKAETKLIEAKAGKGFNKNKVGENECIYCLGFGIRIRTSGESFIKRI